MLKIVDAWALIAWILDQQPAANRVSTILEQADAGAVSLRMSWVNLGEVYYLIGKRLGLQKAEEFLARIPALPLRGVVPGEPDIVQAARIKAAHRLSYADAFAVALAVREGAPLITGDPEMRGLSSLVAVDWVGD